MRVKMNETTGDRAESCCIQFTVWNCHFLWAGGKDQKYSIWEQISGACCMIGENKVEDTYLPRDHTEEKAQIRGPV